MRPGIPMSPGKEVSAAGLCDFLIQITADAESSGIRPLPDYLARFPGQEVEIAREYLRFIDALPGGAAAPEAHGADPHIHLGTARTAIDRYAIDREIGRGGMGVVMRVRDIDFDRELAMKVIRRHGVHARRRFLEEARITGCLDHTGVVPVHDLGVDESGREFFTMRLVQGFEFAKVIERVHAGDQEFTLGRALEVIIKVCDTMAFAHSRGIIHRDLKPSNVMVGRFGEAYVMDWGLARSLHGDELHDLRIRGAEETGPGAQRDLSDDISPLLTMEGDVLGTPAYMPPEQAEGKSEQVGPRSDVYSVGAMLYHLLTGRRPYQDDGESSLPREILRRVRVGPPTRVRRVRADVPRELAAICDKAMARDPAQRYADMGTMARDLRAFLDQRVVSAYGAGVLEQTKKWIGRNRRLAMAAATLVLAVTIAAIVIRGQRAENSRRLAQLAGPQLIHDFDLMWPPNLASVPMLERWLENANKYLAIQHDNVEQIEALKRRAKPLDPELPAERQARAAKRDFIRRQESFIEWMESRMRESDLGKRVVSDHDRESFAAAIKEHRQELQTNRAWTVPHLTYEFDDPELQQRFDALNQKQDDLIPFLGSEDTAGLIQLAESGLAISRAVEQRTLVEAAVTWTRALASIADRRECPEYRGLRMEPQLGLIPIGRDPNSGLWEFAHWASGRPAERDAHGHLVITEETGLVLVLLPGGTVVRGSQRDKLLGANYDSDAEPDAPLQEEIALEPFFLSKFEMTQAQWLRVTDRCPSGFGPAGYPLVGSSLVLPVENVSYTECERVMRVLGLTLPTEAQWEYAARAGTSTPWSTGCDVARLIGFANFADVESWLREIAPGRETIDDLRFDDGFAGPAPVGSLRANAFGLHDVHGNVEEWCRDSGPFTYDALVAVLTGERRGVTDGTRVLRGGSFARSASKSRSAYRLQVGTEMKAGDIGLRPSRAIDR